MGHDQPTMVLVGGLAVLPALGPNKQGQRLERAKGCGAGHSGSWGYGTDSSKQLPQQLLQVLLMLMASWR